MSNNLRSHKAGWFLTSSKIFLQTKYDHLEWKKDSWNKIKWYVFVFEKTVDTDSYSSLGALIKQKFLAFLRRKSWISSKERSCFWIIHKWRGSQRDVENENLEDFPDITCVKTGGRRAKFLLNWCWCHLWMTPLLMKKCQFPLLGNEPMIYILNDAMNIILHVEASLSNLTQVKAIHKLRGIFL